MFKTLPNILTLSRILLIPVFMLVFYLPFHHAHLYAAFLFGIAGITDLFDGYLARKWGQSSKFGAFLDPVADKLMVAVALVMIVDIPWLHYVILPAVIIIGREIIVSALREWMAETGQRAKIAVSSMAKWKTFLQILGIGFLLGYTPDLNPFFIIVGYLSVYVATILTLLTLIAYLLASFDTFKNI
jgi:CDP-diacylglycerol--glycerol-3-phosphate 3-phosphatidyltransferase